MAQANRLSALKVEPTRRKRSLQRGSRLRPALAVRSTQLRSSQVKIDAGVAQIDALGPVSLKAGRAGRQAETEAAPIRYVAELGGYSERAIRWLTALLVPCCDPLAIVLTAAASAGRGMETRLNDVRHLLDRASVEGE
jgi:hypothetical protein